MTIRTHSKPWMIASTFAMITAAAAGCKSGVLSRHPETATGISAPTTSSAVDNFSSATAQKALGNYNASLKQADKAYDDVAQSATKAAGVLQTGAQQAQADLTRTAQAPASALQQGASRPAQTAQATGAARPQEGTDDLLNSIGPKDGDGSKSTDDPVVLPDPAAGQP